MQPDSPGLLWEMQDAARSVQRFVKNITLAEFKEDALVRSAVYYQLMVVGEALAQLNRTDPVTASRLSDYRRIIGFRNQIVHGYSKLDDETTWRIIEEKLPVLLKELDDLI